MSSSNHDITLQKAREMVELYRANRDSILQPQHQGQNLLLISETFDRQAFDDLLAEPGCAKIRVYYGMDEKLKVHAIVVAADAENHDIIPVQTGGDAPSASTTGIKEEGVPCPDFCPPPDGGPLNP